MNLFPDQISAAGARQLEAQLQFFRTAAGTALDGAEQLAALQFATTRGTLEKSTELLRQVASAKDPRDLFTLASQSHFQFDNMLAYQRKLFGIATAMSGSVIGLQGIVTPAASAALQKLATLPPVSTPAEVTLVADRIIEQTNEVVEELADDSADLAAEIQADAAPVIEAVADSVQPVIDDIIEKTNDVVETLAADNKAAAEPAPAAPTTEAPAEQAAEPIAELGAVAAATGHQPPQASAAPFTVGSSDTPIEVEQVEPVDAAPPVNVAKPGGRQRKK